MLSAAAAATECFGIDQELDQAACRVRPVEFAERQSRLLAHAGVGIGPTISAR